MEQEELQPIATVLRTGNERLNYRASNTKRKATENDESSLLCLTDQAWRSYSWKQGTPEELLGRMMNLSVDRLEVPFMFS